MEKIKLDKATFIKRAMNGDVFDWNGRKYCYDAEEKSPFRVNDSSMDYSWHNINGINEFTVVEPKPKTEEVFEYMYKSLDGWIIDNELMTEEEVKHTYTKSTAYKATGRSWIVEVD